MPTSPSATNPLLSAFAPWFPAPPSSEAPTSLAGVTTWWNPSLDAQTRLWEQMLETQRNFWSMYASFFQSVPLAVSAGTKTVAQEEEGLEPAETVDGIPDALEMQMRTWNHLLDANRSFWTSVSWPGMTNGQVSQTSTAANDAPAVKPAARHAPRKRASAKR